jgi:hypothetical protein
VRTPSLSCPNFTGPRFETIRSGRSAIREG